MSVKIYQYDKYYSIVDNINTVIGKYQIFWLHSLLDEIDFIWTETQNTDLST